MIDVKKLFEEKLVNANKTWQGNYLISIKPEQAVYIKRYLEDAEEALYRLKELKD